MSGKNILLALIAVMAAAGIYFLIAGPAQTPVAGSAPAPAPADAPSTAQA